MQKDAMTKGRKEGRQERRKEGRREGRKEGGKERTGDFVPQAGPFFFVP